MAGNDFAAQVQEDLKSFLDRPHELFFNEKDFQVHLALFLRGTGHYDDVDVEYYIPYSEFGEDYVWKNELYIDVVVRRGAAYIPIELKYPTKKIARRIKRFGEQLQEDITIVKTQGAHNIGMYSFWKDVRRMELVKKRFASVAAGFTVWLTNDPAFWSTHRETATSREMTAEDGVHGRSRCWHDSSLSANHPGFFLDNEYNIQWHDAANEYATFRYCITRIV